MTRVSYFLLEFRVYTVINSWSCIIMCNFPKKELLLVIYVVFIILLKLLSSHLLLVGSGRFTLITEMIVF